MHRFVSRVRGFLFRGAGLFVVLIHRVRALPRYGQALLILGVIALLWGVSLLFSTDQAPESSAQRTVILRPLSELGGNLGGASVVGTVRARSEAALRAEASGTVRGVYSVVGARVPAGFILAELENSAQRAQVTQAEGAYDAARAAQNAVSPLDVVTTARNAYRTAFETLDTTLETEIDTLYGEMTPTGPNLLINPLGSDSSFLSRERKNIDARMDAERITLSSAASADPQTLLAGMEILTESVATLTNALTNAANAINSNATETQVSAIASARATVTGILSSLTAARATLRSGTTLSTASTDAAVKSALGTLRLAESSLEKTRIRTPIAGTVNFLPLRVGDYVATLDHVATVAHNGALEVVAFVSEETLGNLSTNDTVMVEERYPGTVTSIAPALDPVTKQIEIHIAVETGSALVNGQAVRMTLPGGVSEELVSGPILLPLTAVKLTAGARVIFTRTREGRLRGIAVDIGEVRGERIEIFTPLSPDVRIVTDARGLSDGELVQVTEE
ncbi:MAG: HlyD family efflux transporter periplasmic adaptor subunit [Minisyncoccia bacterium]